MHSPSPPEEEVEVWERPREDPSRLRQTWRRLRPFWLGVIVLIAGLALLVFENLGSSGNYWQQHPLATNLATEAVMALALVFGLERFLEARSHRRWRRCGLTIAEDLDRSAGVDETIDSHVLSYCQRVYGNRRSRLKPLTSKFSSGHSGIRLLGRAGNPEERRR